MARKKRPWSRRITGGLWALAAFFAAGYFPVAMWGEPRLALVVMVLAAVPIGIRSASVMRATVWAAVLGLVGGVAIQAGLGATYIRQMPPMLEMLNVSMLAGMEDAAAGGAELAAGLATAAALTRPYLQQPPHHLGVVYALSAVVLSGLSAMVFAHLADRRRGLAERQWVEDQPPA